MTRPLALRTRLLLGAAFWTGGLLGLSIVGWHVFLGYRQPPAFFHLVFGHPSAFAIACVVCLLLGLAQVRRGLSPINQLRTRLAGLREGRARRLGGDYPSEVVPLVGDLNALLDQREQMIDRARAKAGDLAHGLKTPLAVLAQEGERAAAAGHGDLGSVILQQVDRMRRQVDYHLAQARAGASRPSASLAPASLAASAEGIARTLRRLHPERTVHIALDLASDVQVRVDREDLDEMLGNLLDNACKWARTRVSIGAERQERQVVVMIDDDGPGIEASMRAAVLQRGVRADEAAPGSGLGLSIVRDLADAYAGTLTLDDSPLGGVRATLTLPA
jgi:signal transduction histidine kinase